MLAFATNRVHGLGMTPEEFWNSTPREFAAHRALLEDGDRKLAKVLCALHNGPLMRKDEQKWVEEMFMPGYEAPKPTKESSTIQYRVLKGALDRGKKKTPEEVEMQRQIAHRLMRAREAAQAGKSGEVVTRIMQGLL